MNDTTSQKYMPIGVRVFAVLTAGAFLFTSLGAAPAEASFWEERAAARNRQIQSSSAPVLLAQLPASQPLSFCGSIQPTLPSFSPKLSSLMGTAPRWAQGAVTPFADIRSVREGTTGSPRVFLVMDAHDVYSAQRNVARLLAHLGNQGKMVVGVEGTSGEFDLERHRGLLPGVGQSQLVDHLLKKGFLNGSEAYGLTAEKTPALWGVEDSGLYDANVRAYRETLSLEAETKTALEVLKKETLARQAKVYSPELQALDREVQAMHEDRGDMGKYVKAVVEGTGDVRQGSQVRRFMEAKSKEDSLSFPAVEQARAAFIERVSPRLSAFELDSLVRQTTAFRAGSMSGKEYYRDLVSLALTKGVPVSAYPAFQSYIEYISLTDGMDVVALMDELEVLEGRAYARLAKGDAVALTEWTNDLRLAERAVQHAMTPREWDRFEGRRSELAQMVDRSVALGLSRSPAEVLQTNLPRFAAFFEAATARNNTLLENALAEAQGRGATTVALVTGGFHSPALEKLLVEKKISHMVLTPRIEQIPDSSAGYLLAFAPTRTPLERLLLGDRLFLNPPSATAVSVADPTNSFNTSQRALTNAEMAYGAVVASSSGKLEDFLDLWNGRFGKFGDAVVRIVKGVTEIRFSNNKRTALLFASTGTGGTSEVAENQLESAITGQGGKFVERGQIGDIQYALGGRNITSIVPESIAALGFVFLYWGSALSPPIYAVGLLGWMVLGGISLRGIFLGSHHLHEMGHALFLQWFGGSSVKISFKQYAKSLSLKHLIPFSTIFIPGLSPEAHAPRMNAKELPQGWKTRVTALVGPALNLLVVGVLVPLAMVADPVSAQQFVLGAAIGVNLWASVRSVDDFKSAWNGIATYFACGVIGMVYGGPNPKGEAFPSTVQAALFRATRRTIQKGGQSGGVLGVAIKENGHAEVRFFVEKVAKERNRRARLDELIRNAMTRMAGRAQKAGFGGLARLVIVGHTRYGTNLAAPVASNAHPHTSAGEKDTLLYVGDAKRTDLYERPWARGHGPFRMKEFPLERGVAIAHNGDDNETVLYRRGDESLTVSNDVDERLSEHMTGFKNPAQGDSPQIATRLDRWITQGSVRASLRLTLLMVGLESLAHPKEASTSDILERAPSAAFVNQLMETQVLSGFSRNLQSLHGKHPTAGTLEELFEQAGARVGSMDATWDLEESIPFTPGSDLDGWKRILADEGASLLKTAPWFDALSPEEQNRTSLRFADLFLKFFFTGDLRRAGIHLLRRADTTSTYGVMASSLSEGESAIWLRHLQPFYLWLSEDGKSIAGSSESTAFLGARSGDSLFRHRLTLKNGEVAYLQGSRLIIDHVDEGRVAEYDLSQMENVRTQARWLDMETSPYVPKPSTEDIAPEDRVRQDVEMIPWVDQKLGEDFADPSSNNSRSGQALAELLVNRLVRRGRSPNSKGIDVVIVGTEKGYDAAVLHAKTLEKISSMAGRRLSTRVIYGAEFTKEDLVKLRDEGFGPDTVVIGLANSGQTANTFYALNSLHAAWRGLVETREGSGASDTQTAPHFLVSASMDNPYTEEVLGQGLGLGDTFKSRNFVTFPKLDPFHPAEAATVTYKATERLLKEVSVLFADRLAQKSRRWAGGGLSADVPRAIRQMITNGDELNRRITGIDADGNPHRTLRQTGETNDIPDQIKKVADRLSQAFLESLWATGATALFITVTLLFHVTPATLLLSWVPNSAFLFSGGVPALAAGLSMVGVGFSIWKARAWRWHPLFFVLGGLAVLSIGLFSGEALVLGLDYVGHAVGSSAWGSRWGMLPIHMDVSPVNLLNAVTYIFFFFGFTLGLRKVQGRPLWDRLGGRILVLSDAQHSVARLSAGRWRRMLSHRYAWMGLNSINESSRGRLTHEEALNSNNRGNIYFQGEARNAEGPTIMNYKQLGGSPNGRGRAWRLGIVHRSREQASPAYSEGLISLFMKGDNPAGENPDLMEIQELVQDAPARDTAGMSLALAVAEAMSSVPPLGFVVGRTSSEAATSTTSQPESPLSDQEVWDVFGVRPLENSRTKIPSEGPSTVEPIEKADSVSPTKTESTVTPPVSTQSTTLSRSPASELGSQRDGLSALAASLGISVSPTHSIEQLERDIRLKFSLSKTPVDVSSEHEKALMLVLSSGEEAYRNRVQVTNQYGESELLPVARFQKGRKDRIIPEWKLFRVVHNGNFLASEVPEKESLGEEEMKQNHLEDVVSLAGYLGLPVGEGDGEDRLAELIENHLKGRENIKIPGQFEEALLFVMFKAQNRTQNRVFSHYWTGKKQGSETLNGFLEMRHGSWTPWESYFVSFVDAMGGVHYFEISPKPMESAEEVSGGQDSPTVEEKPSSEEDRVPESVVKSNEESLKSDGKFQTFLRRVLRGAVRSTGILFVAFLLTSWGGTFTDSLERAATGLFSQPVVSAENNSQGTRSPSGGSIPADAPRVVVNTKSSPLISFDKNPGEKIRPVGQLRINTSVNIVDRQGGYVLVKAPSGLKGWTSSRNVQGEKDGKARVLRNVRLLGQKPAVRMSSLAKGTELAVLETQGKWVHVVDQTKKQRWVRGSYLAEKKDVEPSQQKPKSPSAQKTVEISPTLPPEPVVSGVHQLLALMGRPAPILGEMVQRGVKESFSQNRPGAVLHRRLLAGARLEIEDGPQRKAAMALMEVIDQPSAWEETERQLVLALGYGAVAGESWAQNGAPQDRPLYDDYRQTRALLNRGTLPAQKGRALTRLARRASRWTLNASPAFGEGSLPVIDLTHAEDETQLLSHWVAALDRASQGGPAPVLVVQNMAQQGRLRGKLEEWQKSHRVEPSVLSAPSHWVALDALGADVAKRDMDGSLLSVRLGALLGAAQVDVRRLLSVDIVTGVHSPLQWDRSDVPENIAVRMIIGFLKELSLTATLDDAKDALRSAREALTAA